MNEKVTLEVAAGASLAGRRSLVCTKSVGTNVLLDPLMTLNLTGVEPYGWFAVYLSILAAKNAFVGET